VHGVVHRDVKPENILVGAFGEAVLLDWGVAKVWAMDGAEEEDRVKRHEVLTDVYQRPGTPLYMSPEQVRGGGADIDARTDVYSVGAVLYEMLTLTEPLRGAQVQETFEKIVSEMPPPPRERAPERHIPGELAEICMRALAKKPQERFSTMQEMIEAIRDFRGRALESLPSA
jgi:serine/threonine-protein kinase